MKVQKTTPNAKEVELYDCTIHSTTNLKPIDFVTNKVHPNQ